MASRSARFGILSRKNKTLYPNYVAYESDVRNIKAIQANARLQETGLPVFLRAKEIGKHVLFYVRGEHDLLGVFGQARTLVKRLECALALGEATRRVFDVSTRMNLNQVNDRSSMRHLLGIDFLKTFAVNGRDVGTLLLQPYLIRAVYLSPHPELFDDPNDVALQLRNLYCCLPPVFDRSMQISIGHVELP